MHLSVVDFHHAGYAPEILAAVDGLGYRRYWLGEHHSKWQCPNPLLLGALLATTSQGIRLGSGGICLDYHSPLRVAEDARLIEFMLPGYFDLGVTRGLRLEPRRLAALLGRKDVDPEELPEYLERLSELHGLVTGRMAKNHPLAEDPLPFQAGPPMWVLGASLTTASWAARNGTGFCVSLHHLHDRAKIRALLDEYRRAFLPNPEFEQPALIVLASVLADAVDSSPERLDADAAVRSSVHPTFSGSPEACAQGLEELTRELDVEEIMLLDLPGHRTDERLHLYRSLARLIGLPARNAEG
ncbi:MAG TPA: LLM class flavin-dependent oxidoreductase [Thermoanaerobaculia bacterium]|jgi:luciferase family oxidoreductase group 1|nr:LLM class flavin-dependent oxidoreductase [Thermoanaerobaculia bacterium]